MTVFPHPVEIPNCFPDDIDMTCRTTSRATTATITTWLSWLSQTRPNLSQSAKDCNSSISLNSLVVHSVEQEHDKAQNEGWPAIVLEQRIVCGGEVYDEVPGSWVMYPTPGVGAEGERVTNVKVEECNCSG